MVELQCKNNSYSLQAELRSIFLWYWVLVYAGDDIRHNDESNAVFGVFLKNKEIP